jgi:hypothetical protein
MFPWTAAILLGALAPAMIVAGLSANIVVLPMAFGITIAHSIVLGLPAALLYRAKQWKRVSAAMIGAALIGAIPVGLFAWPINPSLRTTASVDGVTTIIDGIPTLAGWLGYLKLLGMFGSLGAAGGLVFWLTLRGAGVLTVTDLGPVKPTRRQRRIGLLLAAAAMAASAAVFALPSVTLDRSCHNLFRDGRNSVSPKVRIDLDIATTDWSRLTRLLDEFAVSHGMSFRNSNDSKPAVVEILGLSACDENGRVITADDLRWASRADAALGGDRGVTIGVFALKEDTGSLPLAQELVAALNSEWQGKVRLRARDGRFISGSAALVPQLEQP